jgi:hypothetical protein
MTAASKAANQTLSSDVLIQAILEEADNKAAEKNVDDARENAAMIAGQKGKKGHGRKSRPKKDKSDLKCDNCNFSGHTSDKCFAPGGGREKEAPEWWKEKYGKGKQAKLKGKSLAANVAEDKESNMEENYAFLIDSEDVALVCTSDFHEEALRTGITP